MQPPHQHSRINLVELKSQIVRKLGPERSKQYFYYLNRLLGLKISKAEFDKLCVRTLGRENISLHNQFIRSILKNASSAKVPPSAHGNESLVHATGVSNKEPVDDAIEQNGSLVSTVQASNQPAFLDHKAGDHHCSLGLNGKIISTSQKSTITGSCDFKVIEENGDYRIPDVQKAGQHHQGLMQQTGNNAEESGHDPMKFSLIKRPSSVPVSVHNKGQVREEGKESHAKVQPQAPLGVPFCQVSVGGARRVLPMATGSKCVSTSTSGTLLDSLTLRERMEQIAVAHGLEGVSMDCANILNNGLDSYLKSIIRSCVQLVGARSGHEPTKPSKKHPTYGKLVNGIGPGHNLQLSSCRPLEVIQEQTPRNLISLQDFKVAMELNPQQLGEDWPLLLEKICTQAFDE